MERRTRTVSSDASRESINLKRVAPVTAVIMLLAFVLSAASPATLCAQSVSYVGFQTTVPITGEALLAPIGVAADAAGNVFIADSEHSRVVEVLANGTQTNFTTVAGTPLQEPFGVAVDSAGDLFIADSAIPEVFEIATGSGGAATGAQREVTITGLESPTSAAIDTVGDLFIGDSAIPAVFEVADGSGGPATGAQTTVTVTGLKETEGVAVDGAGDLFVADLESGKVFERAAGSGGAATGAQTTVSITGVADPYGVAVDGKGDLFVTDSFSAAKVLRSQAEAAVPLPARRPRCRSAVCLNPSVSRWMERATSSSRMAATTK